MELCNENAFGVFLFVFYAIRHLKCGPGNFLVDGLACMHMHQACPTE